MHKADIALLTTLRQDFKRENDYAIKHDDLEAKIRAHVLATRIARIEAINQPESSEQRTDRQRDSTRDANYQSLIELSLLYGLVFPSATFANWRPTTPISGMLNGFEEQLGPLTIIATDGIVGDFIVENRSTDTITFTFRGHIDYFDGEISPLHSVPKPQVKADKPIKTKAYRQKVESLILDDIL